MAVLIGPRGFWVGFVALLVGLFCLGALRKRKRGHLQLDRRTRRYVEA